MITDKMAYLTRVNKAVEYLNEEYEKLKLEERPNICIVLGSGLGPLVDYSEVIYEISYKDIPEFPVSTAPGHAGKLVIARLSGKIVFFMSGRFHYYEGYGYEVCTFYVRVMAKFGVKNLILTNASGGINTSFVPTDLMIIKDHFSIFMESPLRGPNLEEFGTRFPNQTNVYDHDYIELLEDVANENNISVHKGVYCYTKGPQYETPAEIRALGLLGADAVGMSTVPEAIVASHSGMKVLAVSCITNYAAGLSPEDKPDGSEKLEEELVLNNAKKASSNCCDLIAAFISKI